MTDGVQFIDCVYAALRLVCDVFNRVGYLMDASIDFFGDRRLLLRGAGDVRVHRIDSDDQLDRFAQRLPGLFRVQAGAMTCCA